MFALPRRRLLASALLGMLGALSVLPSFAQNYPARPITLIDDISYIYFVELFCALHSFRAKLFGRDDYLLFQRLLFSFPPMTL